MDVRKVVVASAFVGIALGVGLGFLIGWGIWPVEYYDTDPVDLKEEHKEEYIVLVAASYAISGDLDQAKVRLAKLEEEDVAQAVADLAERYLQRGENMTVTRNLVMLAEALGSATEVMLAYVATATPTFTPTPTHTPTDTPSPTPTETPTTIPTDTPTATLTPLPPTPTFTPRPPTPTLTAAPPTSTPGSQSPTNTPTATQRPPSACPDRPGVTVKDISAQVRDWRWVQQTFGGVAIQETSSCPDGAVYAVTTLWEFHDTALRVTVLDRNGNLVPNVPVAFFGFEASTETIDTPGACRPNAHIEYTNQDGEANVPMGWGSAYIPPAAGYHAVWIMNSSSDCVTGLGMVDYTNHWHLNVTFREFSR
jgi:hypothetical protein